MESISSARNVYIWGIIGAFLIIMTEILPWSSGYSGFDLIWLESFTYWFPLFGGAIIFVGAILGMFKPKRQIAPVLFQFSGLSLVLLFIADYLQTNYNNQHSWYFLNNVQAAFFSLFIGISIVFLEIIGVLTVRSHTGSNN